MDDPQTALKVAGLCKDAERVAELRRRLGSLSWFMRFMNERIARLANHEDACKGRFWEGRFVSRALLDEAALLSAMVYADLNPLRAGIVSEPQRAAHTSVRRRAASETPDTPLAPVISGMTDPKGAGRPSIRVSEYLDLVSYTAHSRSEHSNVPPMLSRLGVTAGTWQTLQRAQHRNLRAYGSIERLRAYARRCGQHWVHGCGQAATVRSRG